MFGVVAIFTAIFLNFPPVSFSAFFSLSLLVSIYLFYLTETNSLVFVSNLLAIFLFLKAMVYDVFENLNLSSSNFSYPDYSNIHLRAMEYFIIVSTLWFVSRIALKKGKRITASINKLFTGASILAFATYEVSTFFYHIFKKGESMAVSILWAIFATVLFLRGTKFKKTGEKVASYILFCAVLIKVFFFDMVSLPTIYKILSFFITGIIFILSSYMYYRYEKEKEGA